MAPMRRKLFAVREKRVRPGLDDKVLTSWNGLMITALAQGSRILNEPRYAQAAAEAGAFIMEHMMQDGVLLRTQTLQNPWHQHQPWSTTQRSAQRWQGNLQKQAHLRTPKWFCFQTNLDLDWTCLRFQKVR